jgi:lysyl-tRNA synthetase class 2
MKKLLAAGERRIFSFQHVWRNRERTARHHPEFTLLEWYRVGQPYDALIDDCAAFLRLTGSPVLRHGDLICDPLAPIKRVSVAEAFERFAGIDLLATLDERGAGLAPNLREACAASNLTVADDDSWSDMFSKVLSDRIEPNLGLSQVVALDRYPACEAALARPAPDDPRVAERFELYACGVELANGFGELTDAVEQRRRFIAEMDEKERVYGTRYPLDEDFLTALAQMPPASGMALGFDRLVMLATGAPRIEDVIWTPLTL